MEMDFVRDSVDLNLFIWIQFLVVVIPESCLLQKGWQRETFSTIRGAVEQLPTSLEEAFEYGGVQMQNLFRKIKVFEDGFEQERTRRTGENKGERPRPIHQARDRVYTFGNQLVTFRRGT